MELQRILAKDSRSAMEQVHTLYGKDALVVSNKRAKDKTELIVAVDLEADLKNSLDEINLGNCGHHLSSSSNFQDVMEEKVFGTQVQEKDMLSDRGILMALPNEYEDVEEDPNQSKKQSAKPKNKKTFFFLLTLMSELDLLCEEVKDLTCRF